MVRRLRAGAEGIRTFSSALDRRRFRGFVRVGVDHRPTVHPSRCGVGADRLPETIDPARRAIAGTQTPSDLELTPRIFGAGKMTTFIIGYTSEACCGRRLAVRHSGVTAEVEVDEDRG